MEVTKRQVKEQRLVNLKVKKQLEVAETILTAVQTEREKFMQNYNMVHKHTGEVATLGISGNSEYLTSIAPNETNVWLIKNGMVQILVSIPRDEEPGNGFTAGVRPLACIDNSGTKVVIFRGGGLNLSVFDIKDRKTFERKDTINVIKELAATGQPGFLVTKEDIIHEIRFLSGESENVRIHL